MNLAEVIQRGTAAARPAATAVPSGCIYYSTDTATTDRSNGTTWETIADAGTGGASDWEFTLTKSADQTVTNSDVLVDATDLLKAVLANEVWLFEFAIAYSGTNASADYKWALNCSAGTMTGCAIQACLSTANAAQTTGVAFNASANAGTASGTDAVSGIRPLWIRAILVFTTNCNFTFQFAQNVTTAAQSVTTKQNSIMRCKKIM